MLRDADIRDGLCDYLETKYGKIRFFEELTMGKSRADIVMVTDLGMYGIEIKSDSDTYERLSRQVKDYDRFFDYNYVVVGSSHAGHIKEHVPEYSWIVTQDTVLFDISDEYIENQHEESMVVVGGQQVFTLVPKADGTLSFDTPMDADEMMDMAEEIINASNN